MDAARDELLPTPDHSFRRGFLIALVAHALLILALALSVRWRVSEPSGVDAELWASVPQSAAPQQTSVAPTPITALEKSIKNPLPTQPDPAQLQAKLDAQIAVEKDKARKEQEKKEQELARKEREKALALEEEKQKEKQREQDRKKQAQLQALEQVEKEKKEQERHKEEQKQKQRDQTEREAQIKRILNQAGAAGGQSGRAQRNAGPSAGYAGKIKAAIRPHVKGQTDVPGNPVAEVEVRVAASGEIIGRRLIKSSGVPEWDDIVLDAIDHTQQIPRDVDGGVVSPLVLVFKRQDF